MPESDKIRRLRDKAKLLQTNANRANHLFQQSLNELNAELTAQPPAPPGFHTESQHVWRAATDRISGRWESCRSDRTVLTTQ